MIEAIDGTSVVYLQLGLVTAPADGTWSVPNFQLKGIPQIWDATLNAFPTACALGPNDGQLTVSYDTLFGLVDHLLWLAPWDPAIRTRDGGFLAAGWIKVTS